jgi:hypothetical protein
MGGFVERLLLPWQYTCLAPLVRFLRRHMALEGLLQNSLAVGRGWAKQWLVACTGGAHAFEFPSRPYFIAQCEQRTEDGCPISLPG